MRLNRVLWTALLASLLAGCEGARSFLPSDLGTVVAEWAPVAPAAPSPAQLPVFTPCPTGWREAGADPVVCEPWPGPDAETCSDDSAHFPGEPGCSRVGTACPAGAWAALPGDKTIRYVLATAAAGGTGSTASPFPTLAEAFAVAQPGDIIALGRGQYGAESNLPTGVTVWGACTAETTLLTVTPSRTAVVATSGSGVVVKNLRVTSAHVGVSISGSTASLGLEDVILDGVAGAGLLIENGAHLTASSLVIRRILDEGGSGVGVQLSGGAGLEASRVVIDRVSASGVVADGAGTRATLRQVAIRNASGMVTDGRSGRGVTVQRAATVKLSDAVVEHTREDGLVAIDGAFELENVLVRDIKGRVADGLFGLGLSVNGGSVAGTRLRIEQSVAGIDVRKAAGSAHLAHVLIRDLRPTNEITSGVGVTAALGSTLSLEHGLVSFASRVGVAVGSSGTKAQISDLTVLDTLGTRDNGAGIGVFVLTGAELTLNRAILRSNSSMGLAMGGSRLTANDLIVTDTLEGSTSTSGAAGLLAYAGVTVVGRALLERNFTTGVEAVDGADVQLDDLTIRQSRASTRDGIGGVGIQCVSGANVHGTRVRLTENGMTSLYAAKRGSRLTLSQVEVSETTMPPCVSVCAQEVSSGVLATDSGAISLSQFLVTRNGGIGVQLDATGQIDLQSGRISQHRVGANVMNAAYDLTRLDHDVIYVDNEQKLSSEVFVLPMLPPGPRP